MARCQFCSGLTLCTLVRLAKEEFQIGEFPQHAYYEHHESFFNLEQAAHQGCDLCSLILDCFKGTPVDDLRPTAWPTKWLGPACPIDGSMYSVVRELSDSHIRLALNTNMLRPYGCDTEDIEAVSVFNALLVQVGLRSKPSEEDLADTQSMSDSEYYEYYGPGGFWEVPCLQLRLRTAEGKELASPFCQPQHHSLDVSGINEADRRQDKAVRIDRFRVGLFELDPFLGSKGNFSRIREWLTCCREQHPQCASANLPVLPTRIIDIEGVSGPKIFHSQGLKAEYVALSHCWGGDIQPKLLSNTLHVYQNALPYKSLAANFRDAITITRELGFRYLWIDSLCIIQDSKTDWQQESQKMCSVYQNASLTISALESPGSKHGILNQAPMINEGPQPIFFNFSSRIPNLEGLEISMARSYEENLELLDDKCPLSTRGWTLQEGILSPRHVFYGTHQVYWSCRQGFKSADGRDDPGISYHHGNIKSLLLSGDTTHSVPSLFQDYYLLVHTYSHRKLSFPSDKLPAISGIAQALHSRIKGEYLAGIWSEDLSGGLLWFIECDSAKHVLPYRAPSWSWAVTDDPIQFHEVEEPIYLHLELLNHEIISKDMTNLYGEISSATLTIKGLTKPLIRSNQIVKRRPEGQCGYVHFDEGVKSQPGRVRTEVLFPATQPSKGEFLLSISFEYVAGEPDWVVDPGCFYPEPYLACIVSVTEDRNTEGAFASAGLVLQRVGDQKVNTYQRVGFFQTMEQEFSYYEDWEAQILNLI